MENIYEKKAKKKKKFEIKNHLKYDMLYKLAVIVDALWYFPYLFLIYRFVYITHRCDCVILSSLRIE